MSVEEALMMWEAAYLRWIDDSAAEGNTESYLALRSAESALVQARQAERRDPVRQLYFYVKHRLPAPALRAWLESLTEAERAAINTHLEAISQLIALLLDDEPDVSIAEAYREIGLEMGRQMAAGIAGSDFPVEDALTTVEKLLRGDE